MTKKGYRLMAERLANIRPELQPASPAYAEAYGQWVHAVRTVADVFGELNPRFDRAKFLRACGVSNA